MQLAQTEGREVSALHLTEQLCTWNAGLSSVAGQQHASWMQDLAAPCQKPQALTAPMPSLQAVPASSCHPSTLSTASLGPEPHIVLGSAKQIASSRYLEHG